MHLHLTTLLAHPTNTTTTTPLLKRDHYGWIGSFAGPCTTAPIGPRPKLPDSRCIPFQMDPRADHIGINWGVGEYKFSTLTFFTNGHCGDTFWYDDEGKALREERGESRTVGEEGGGGDRQCIGDEFFLKARSLRWG